MVEYTAAASSDLVSIGTALFQPRGNQNRLDEQVSMTRLLEIVALTHLLEFPARICHTPDAVPDFLIDTPDRRIGVETAKIANQNLEHARDLQRRATPIQPRTSYAERDIADAASLANRLRLGADPCAKHVVAGLSSAVQALLASHQVFQPISVELRIALVDRLNEIVHGPPLWQVPEFTDLPSAPLLAELGADRPEAYHRIDNRMLLDEAFDPELAQPTNWTLMPNRFLGTERRPMRRPEVFNTGFMLGQEERGLALLEEHVVWLLTALCEVRDKTERLEAGAFRRSEENWLVLWDRLGSAEWQMESRMAGLSNFLAGCWTPDWFSRVFVQAEHFEWQAMLTWSGWAPLPTGGAAKGG